MISSLSNKTAFVTGASRGIGRATALVLASRGAYVLVTTAKGLPRRKRWLLRLIGTVERLIQRAQALSPQTRPHAQTFLRDAVSARCELLPGRHCEEKNGEGRRKRVVDEESHSPAARGRARSRTASAAKSRASRMSSASRSGYRARICSGVCPSATSATTVATGIRRPRTHGTPPIWRGFVVIRVNSMLHCSGPPCRGVWGHSGTAEKSRL